MQFRDREKECAEIAMLLGSKRFEFLILYGRRRIGKTELVLHSTRGKKRLYYLATTEKNLDRFYNTCVEFDPKVAVLKKDFEVLFDYLKDRAAIIIIDEFQNMIKEDKNIVSLLQAIVDNKLKKGKSKLMILGSSISLMTSRVLSYQSPLYGRRTASIKLKPISFFDLRQFFPKPSNEELVEIFGFADGVPYYLIKIEENFWRWLEKELKQEKSFLRDEVDFLMHYEFDNPSTYKLILEAIANGKTTVNEIKDYIKVQRTDLSQYLKNLLQTELIKKEVPINENQKSRNGRYYLNDNFLKFWFKFIYPSLSSIEAGIFNPTTIKKEYSAYLGNTFEQITRQFIAKNKQMHYTKIGKWWHKDKEIDLIALNETNKEALFVECKWQNKVNAIKIAKRLNEKTAYFNWNNEKRKEKLAIFAKSFSKKITKFEGKKIQCITLKEMTNTKTIMH